MAFPSGLDWSLHSYDQITYLAWLATHFNDPDAQWAERKLSKQILYRQAINGDGRFVGESCRSGAGGGSTDDFYAVAIMSSYIAEAYLHNEMAGFPKSEGTAPKNHITHYSDVGL